MRTQKLIHPATPARTPWISTPELLAPWTTQQIVDEVTSRVLAERNTDLYKSRPTRLGPFRQPCVRRLVLPQPAPHRWGVVLAGGDGVRLRELTRWMYGEDRPKQFCHLLGDRTLLEEGGSVRNGAFGKGRFCFRLRERMKAIIFAIWRTGHRNVSFSRSTEVRPPQFSHR